MDLAVAQRLVQKSGEVQSRAPSFLLEYDPLMRRFSLALLTLTAVPLSVFAFQIQPDTLFTDVRRSSREVAGINLLAREGVVQGYKEGRFGPSRRINRAEFLHISILALAHHPKPGRRPTLDLPVMGADSDPYCFPDVPIGDWFSRSVCFALSKGIVQGNPDGLFHPERTITYGEALKILTLLYGYEIHSVSGADWAEPYYAAAAARQVDLPMTIRLDTPLTRAMAARLTAAFLAESDGQLTTLRLAEAGQFSSVSSSSQSMSSSDSSVSSSSVSSASSVSSVSSKAALFTLPPTSHFLTVGRKSDAIASITVRSANEIARIAAVQVKLYAEVLALDTLELVRVDNGAIVAVLLKRTTSDLSDYKMTYEVQVNPDTQARIAANTDVPLLLRATIRGIDNNGASDQLLEVRTLLVTLRGESSNQTSTVVAIAPFPKHQTSFGRITQVARMSPAIATLRSGTGVALNVFSTSGSAIPGKSLSLEHLSFTLLRTGQFAATNWRLAQVRPTGSSGQVGSTAAIPCTVNQDGTLVSCTGISSIASLSTATPLLLELRADLTVPSGTTNASLRADLATAGSPSELGSVQWTDQSGHFRWIEGTSPVMRGTLWQSM